MEPTHYRKSLQEGQVPTDWKLANIIPLHKKGPKSSPENYRPISLTSVLSNDKDHGKTSESIPEHHLKSSSEVKMYRKIDR